jgi:hypothetical protein
LLPLLHWPPDASLHVSARVKIDLDRAMLDFFAACSQNKRSASFPVLVTASIRSISRWRRVLDSDCRQDARASTAFSGEPAIEHDHSSARATQSGTTAITKQRRRGRQKNRRCCGVAPQSWLGDGYDMESRAATASVKDAQRNQRLHRLTQDLRAGNKALYRARDAGGSRLSRYRASRLSARAEKTRG